MKLSVQTAVLPELTSEQVVQALRRHGYDGVEWRLHEDYHLNPAELPAKAHSIRQLVTDHGLEVACMMSYLPLTDLEAHRRVAEACAILGCPRYRPGAVIYDGSRRYHDLFQETVERLGELLWVVVPYGVKPLIETHFGTLAPSASLAYRLVQHFDAAEIGVNYDPANLVVEGREAWLLGLELLGPYLAYVHVKNIAWQFQDGVWRWQFTALDQGQVDWQELIPLLQRYGYQGYLSVENFYRVPVRSTGYVGEDLTQDVASYRDIDQRLAEDRAFLLRCLSSRSAMEC